VKTQHHATAAGVQRAPLHSSDARPDLALAQILAFGIALAVVVIWARLTYVFLRWLFRSRGESL